MSHKCRTTRFLWGTESLSNHEKYQYYYWVCPSGIAQWPPDPDSALCAVPGDLPADISGEHSDDPDHQGWCSAPHTHVFLPRTPVFPGSQLLLKSLCPKCYGTSCLRRKASQCGAASLRVSFSLSQGGQKPVFSPPWPTTAMLLYATLRSTLWS